jgi:hypothetical protein
MSSCYESGDEDTTMRSDKAMPGTENKSSLEFNKVEAIAGYAYVGAWIGLILGFSGLVGPAHSSQVSLGLAALGAGVGVILVGRK